MKYNKTLAYYIYNMDLATCQPQHHYDSRSSRGKNQVTASAKSFAAGVPNTAEGP